jgi:hypothetical protein
MPSIHRQTGRPYWFCAFSIFNPETNTQRRVFRSTKTSDKPQALEICRAWHKAALKARSGRLSVDAAREVIARGVADVFTAANVESMPGASICSWCETWLQSKAIEAEQSTHLRYKIIVERFVEFLGPKAKRDLSTLAASDIARFRDREASVRSRSTASFSVRVLRIALGEAVRQGLLTVSPAVRVKLLKVRQTRSHALGNQTGLESMRGRHRMARPHSFRFVSRPTSRRLGKAHLACSESRKRRDCIHGAQDRTTNRVAARPTDLRLLVISPSER